MLEPRARKYPKEPCYPGIFRGVSLKDTTGPVVLRAKSGPKNHLCRLLSGGITIRIVLLLCLLAWAAPPVCSLAQQPIKLIEDTSPQDRTTSAGAFFKLKNVSGPMGFGGEVPMYGLRFNTGNRHETKLGITGTTGYLEGTSLKLRLYSAGLTFEDAFKSDPRLWWSLGIGGGTYSLKTRINDYALHKGFFVYFEPMFFGIIHMNRHFRLQFGAGYTFCNSKGVRIEGPCIQAELLVGRY